MTDQQNTPCHVPEGIGASAEVAGGIARRALVLPETLHWATPPVLQAIAEERVAQIDRGYTSRHDDSRALGDWVGLLFRLVADIDTDLRWAHGTTRVRPALRAALVRLAATAVAAVEAIDRREAGHSSRHRDSGAPNSPSVQLFQPR